MIGQNENFKPKISIITVTYNAAESLEKTILSVGAQVYANIEFIVIDGSSSDRTMDILHGNSDVVDRFISETDQGIYDAMNKGLAIATGDYVLFLNAGDYFCDDSSLENIISAARQPVEVIYGDIQLVAIDGKSQHHKARPFTLENLLKFGTGVLCHQAILVRRDIAPMYNSSYVYKGELNWYFDILKNKPDLIFFHHKEPVVYYFLGGKGYQDFIRNRLEWYGLLIRRFGRRSVFNKHFLKFIYKDFTNRYDLLRKIT